jgi:archaellum biogenesis ATPase FlaH
MGERHALLISTGSYQDERFRLLGSATTDSEELADVLADPRIGDFEVKRIHDEPYFSIVETIGDFLADRNRDDTLLVYLSGHGVRNVEGELYFAATNTRPDRLDETAVPAERLARQISRSRARRILLLLDCCFGGAFPAGARPKSGDHVELPNLPSAGHVVIAATSAIEYAFEPDQADSGPPRASVFTEAVLLGLRTGDADRDQDGVVTIHDLFSWLTESLREVSPAQTPTMHGSGLQGDFVVAKNPSPISANMPTPHKDGSAGKKAGATGRAHQLVWLSDTMGQLLDELEVHAADSGRIAARSAIPSGHADLDEVTMGFGPGDLVLLTGANGVGKSMFALGITRATAVRNNYVALYVTYESTRAELMLRILSAEAKVPLHHLRDGSMADDDWGRLARTMGMVSSAPIAFIDDPALDLDSLAQTIDARVDHRLVVIDNLQLLANSDDPGRLVGAVRTLKLLAKAKGVTIVLTVAPDDALATLENPVDALARYADVVINIVRPDQSGWEDRPGEADLMVLKNRHGHGRTLVVAFQGHYARFVDMAQ